MGKQGRGRRLTDRERLEIIEFARQNPHVKHVELAATYHVNESTIRKWRRETNATKVRARCASSGSHERRRGQAERARQFDLALYDWICATRSRGERLRPVQVREKARALAATYEQMGNFKASSGWYYRYCRRFGLTLEPAATSTGNADTNYSSGSDVAPAVAETAILEAPTTGSDSMLELLTSSEYPRESDDAADYSAALERQQEELLPESPSWARVHEPEESAAACQAAIAHFLHHHTALLSRASRSRFIQHLADMPEELKAFAHMSSSARVQFAKTVAERASSSSGSKQQNSTSYMYRPALVL